MKRILRHAVVSPSALIAVAVFIFLSGRPQTVSIEQSIKSVIPKPSSFPLLGLHAGAWRKMNVHRQALKFVIKFFPAQHILRWMPCSLSSVNQHFHGNLQKWHQHL
ncbi:MAG: hypothetical protein Q8L79_02550 [Methylobacter sp.]|uniref:hypothetical protein n=1 Tax=Methylobacter sp. TaxID=2051955 RepID=UPI00272FFB9A|nr:hypothetical protein [Methylobacter sp.]MDP1663978.1 hypothetical protein [Methylobacter sp.]MDP1970015.1 hypothetical protein [Methylobacter sp.]